MADPYQYLPCIAFARIDDEQKARLRFAAERRYLPESAIIRELINSLPQVEPERAA